MGRKKPLPLRVKFMNNQELIEESKNEVYREALDLLKNIVELIGCEESFSIKDLRDVTCVKGETIPGLGKNLRFILRLGFLDQEGSLYKINTSAMKYLEQNDRLAKD
jgi:hypothetical protein